MKKVLLLSFLVMCSALSVFAQSSKSFYIKAGGGYAFGAGKSSFNMVDGFPELSQNINLTVMPGISIFKQQTIAYSLGKGFNSSLGVGYMFTENIGVEIECNYLFGATTSNDLKSINQYGADIYETNLSETDMRLASLTVTPSLKLVTPLTEDFSLYSRFGISLPVINNVYQDYKYTYRQEYTLRTTVSEYKRKMSAYYSPGFKMGLGAQIKISKQVYLYGEMNASIASFEVKEGEMTKYTWQIDNDKMDLMVNLPEHEKRTKYRRNYIEDRNAADSGDAPSEKPTFTLPASSIGLSIGIIYAF